MDQELNDMEQFNSEVTTILGKLSNLPQLRFAWVNHLDPDGASRQGRIFQDNDRWMLEKVGGETQYLLDFLGEKSTISAVQQNGIMIVQSLTEDELEIREVGPSSQAFYSKEMWEWIEQNLKSESGNVALVKPPKNY